MHLIALESHVVMAAHPEGGRTTYRLLIRASNQPVPLELTRRVSRCSAAVQSREQEITRLLHDWRAGDRQALDRLTPMVYEELKRLATRLFRAEAPGHTLQPTALVNEAFEALARMDVSWHDSTHFYSLAARLMRRILVNHANARAAAKRGGGAAKVTLDEQSAVALGPDEQLLALDGALQEMAGFDARKAHVIEMHYFGGLSYAEMAQALDLSTTTVHEELRAARAWLQQRLGPGVA
jgi:RNA polymerase sigma factor (TIGR02999 family)